MKLMVKAVNIRDVLVKFFL